ncbi:MAG: hypothetical protein DMD81_06170, partial [Candidatus Rokuibacteriota bacterium]
MIGRVTSIAVDPRDPAHWLIGGALGGVWETRDTGSTWSPRTDAQASLAVGAIAFAPSNANIVYAGTGALLSYGGAGLLKSTDGGSTWTLLASGTFTRNTFAAIRVDPNNADSLIAAVAYGFASHTNFPSTPPRGVFRSTDGGATWSKTLAGDATTVVVDPTNFSNQYVGLGHPFGSSSNGVYRSTNAGLTWTPVTGPWVTMPQGVGRVSVAMAPSNSNTLYIAIQDAFDNNGHDGALLGLFRTDNAWAPTPTFAQVPNPPPTGALGFCGWVLSYNQEQDSCASSMVISTDPAQPDILYAGGIELWKCTNCAASPTWTEISKNADDPIHGIKVDQKALAWVGNRLIVGNDGGVWSTSDGGSTWADHNTNLIVTQFYAGSLHPIDPLFALGGSQDHGTDKWNGMESWQAIFGGDGGPNAISASQPDTHWAVSAQRLDLRRTTDGGVALAKA